MSTDLEKVELEYSVNNDFNKKITKEIPLIKGISILNYFLPVILLAFLTATFLLRIKAEGYSFDAVLWSYIIPIIIYLLFSIPLFILVRNKERNSKKTGEKKVKMVFSEAGINMNAFLTETILDWKYIRKVSQTDSLIAFHFLPKFNFFSIPKILILIANKKKEFQELIDKKITESQIALSFNNEKITKNIQAVEDFKEEKINEADKHLEISFEMTYEDVKKSAFDLLYSKRAFLLLGSIILIFTLFLEVLFITIGVLFGFSFVVKFMMIFFPSFFLFLALLFIIATFISIKITWKQTQKLPLKRSWYFTSKGLVIDEIFRKMQIDWEELTSVNFNYRNTILFYQTPLVMYQLPKRAFNEELLEKLHSLLKEKMDEEKNKKYLSKSN